jgi:hypothetical protein
MADPLDRQDSDGPTDDRAQDDAPWGREAAAADLGGDPETKDDPAREGPAGERSATSGRARATRATVAARQRARQRPSRHQGAVERVSKADFPVVMRGYDRQAVDRYVEEISQLVAELETSQLPETVVQKALDEVGQQTAGILQQARETADEITSRSRAQADGRVQTAEREAEVVRREAEKNAEAVMRDATRLWQERQRLVDDLRRLAEEVLEVADDAVDRVKEPPPPEELSKRAAAGHPEGDGERAPGDEPTAVASDEGQQSGPGQGGP